jgi:hypothetical protein
MTHPVRCLAAGLALGATTFCFLSSRAGEPAGIVPEAQVRSIIKLAVSKVQKALQSKANDRSTPALVRIQAGLIAACAQDGTARRGPEAAELAAVRDAALKLADSVQRRRLDLEQARKQIHVLASFPGLKAEGDARPEPIDLRKKFNLETVMKVFDKTTKGGDGIEQELLSLEQQRRTYSAGQMSEKLEADAYKAALISDLARGYEAEKKTHSKQEWDQLCTDARSNALELAQTVKQKDPKQVKAAVKKLTASCNECHEKFR